MEAWRDVVRQLGKMEVRQVSVWCGEIIAHNEIWDSHMEPDRRGEDLVEMLAEWSMQTLNGGSASRHDRREIRTPGRSAPDVFITLMEERRRFHWEVKMDLSSDHLSIVMEWKTEIKLSRKLKKTELNLKRRQEGLPFQH